MRNEKGVFLGSCLTCNIWKFLFSAEHDYPVWKLSIGDVDMPLYIWYLASIQRFSYQWNGNSRPDGTVCRLGGLWENEECNICPQLCNVFGLHPWWKNIISSSNNHLVVQKTSTPLACRMVLTSKQFGHRFRKWGTQIDILVSFSSIFNRAKSSWWHIWPTEVRNTSKNLWKMYLNIPGMLFHHCIWSQKWFGADSKARARNFRFDMLSELAL